MFSLWIGILVSGLLWTEKAFERWVYSSYLEAVIQELEIIDLYTETSAKLSQWSILEWLETSAQQWNFAFKTSKKWSKCCQVSWVWWSEVEHLVRAKIAAAFFGLALLWSDSFQRHCIGVMLIELSWRLRSGRGRGRGRGRGDEVGIRTCNWALLFSQILVAPTSGDRLAVLHFLNRY